MDKPYIKSDARFSLSRDELMHMLDKFGSHLNCMRSTSYSRPIRPSWQTINALFPSGKKEYHWKWGWGGMSWTHGEYCLGFGMEVGLL
jgi:hypothetical protein